MQRPLKITARDFTLSDAFEAEIRQKAAALDNYYHRITGCDVTVTAPIDHHRKGGPFDVRIRLTVPGKELVTNRQSEEGLAAAIREAFDAIRRQLEDYVREQRGQVKTHEEAAQGRVVRLLNDFGFLETPDGREIYFHRNSVLNNAFDKLRVGMQVRFVEEEGIEGPQASTVAIVERKH
ncbi:MAG TPA: HPF/RaiA family ribosome-associated protein [Terriglobales bacterium]|jgi:ribosome-associated translation inhibitor RaiA|nr:HPF/RaiA family ribosome-associated protein [Terriglobales bacterium]